MDLKKFNVIVECFNPVESPGEVHTYVLPVDSPDEEHAVSAAMTNAIAFTTKTDGGTVLPLAFRCTAVNQRT